MTSRKTPAIVMVTAMLILSGCSRIDFPHRALHRDPWQPPPQTLLSSPMERQPVPGWRTRVSDLGLPAGVTLRNDTVPLLSVPFIGNDGDRAYFLAAGQLAEENTQWWLTGVDVSDGHRIFPPVRLTGARSPECFLNGPRAVLCFDNRATAWVIEVPEGRVSYSGPTDLSTAGGHDVEQVGMYAVSNEMEKGVYGVGPQAQRTWFVPGEGSVHPRWYAGDFAPEPLAVQTGPGLDHMTVFRLSDGHIFEPELSDGEYAQGVAVYPGGFAVDAVRDHLTRGVEFFDEDGKRIRRLDTNSGPAAGPQDVPYLANVDEAQVFGADGSLRATIPGLGSADHPMLIGSGLFVGDPYEGVKQWSLETGLPGATCQWGIDSYIGTDGRVGLFNRGNPTVGLQITAHEFSTGAKLWTWNSPPGTFRAVQRINTTLVQLSDDATELMSLVDPRP